MRFTYAKGGHVVVDGRTFKIEATEMPDMLNAIQWEGESLSVGKGHLEIAGLPNLAIASIEPFQYLFDRWTDKKTEFEVEEEKARLDREWITAYHAARAENNAMNREQFTTVQKRIVENLKKYELKGAADEPKPSE